MNINNDHAHYEDCPNCGSPMNIGHYVKTVVMVQPDETFQCGMCSSYVVVQVDDEQEPVEIWLTEIDGPKS